MATELFANNAATTLAAGITSGATSLTVASSTGFPAAVAGVSQFRVIIDSELLIVTAVSGTTWTVTRGAESTTAAAHTSGAAVTQIVTADAISTAPWPTNYYLPSTAAYETIPRSLVDTSLPIATGTLYLSAIGLPAGQPVGRIGMMNTGSGASGPTHYWFALFDSNRNLLAITADQLTTAWAGFTLKTLTIATTAAGSATSFTTTYSGIYYVGYMLSGTSSPSIQGASLSNAAGVSSLAPILCGSSTTGLTTPPAFPFTASAVTGVNTDFYAFVGA